MPCELRHLWKVSRSSVVSLWTLKHSRRLQWHKEDTLLHINMNFTMDDEIYNSGFSAENRTSSSWRQNHTARGPDRREPFTFLSSSTEKRIINPVAVCQGEGLHSDCHHQHFLAQSSRVLQAFIVQADTHLWTVWINTGQKDIFKKSIIILQL